MREKGIHFPYQKILCIRVDNMGDVLMTTPALRAIKQSYPYSHLALLVSPLGAKITPFISMVDRVITTTTPWVKNNSMASANDLSELIKMLRAAQFDKAIIFTSYSQSSLPAATVCYLADIPLRIAYARENPYELLTHWIPDREPFFDIQHEVSRQLKLVSHIGAYTLDDHISVTVSQSDEKSMQEKLVQKHIDLKKPWIILHPEVSEKKREYPIDKWVEIGKCITEKLNYRVVLTGSKGGRAKSKFIQENIGSSAVSFAGDISLGEFIALVKLSPLVISVNSLPIHIASAVSTPVIALYAQTNPQHTPWLVPHQVLQFSIAQKLKSKNTLLSFTDTLIYRNNPQTVEPDTVIQFVKKMMNETESHHLYPNRK